MIAKELKLRTFFTVLGFPSLTDPLVRFWKVLKARLTMSLSPILSIIKDFLVIGRAPKDSDGPKLRDMCKDVGAALLLSLIREVLLFGGAEAFTFFFEDREAETGVETDVGFACLGVDACNGLAAGEMTFFFVKTFSFFIGIT